MLEYLDVGLEAFVRAAAPLSATDVDVSFEPPDREWSAKLNRPTVNLFLWDIRRSSGRSQAGVRTVERNGAVYHEPALPVVELRYLVTTWTAEHLDERSILSALMRAFLTYDQVPEDYLPDEVRHLGPPNVAMARSGEDHIDVFKALEGQLKPSLNIVVSARVDVDIALPAGPPVGSIGVAVGRRDRAVPPPRRRVAGEVLDALARNAVGVVARSPHDAALVNSAGQFLLRAEAGDEIVLELDPPLTTTVPDDGGIRFG